MSLISNIRVGQRLLEALAEDGGTYSDPLDRNIVATSYEEK